MTQQSQASSSAPATDPAAVADPAVVTDPAAVADPAAVTDPAATDPAGDPAATDPAAAKPEGDKAAEGGDKAEGDKAEGEGDDAPIEYTFEVPEGLTLNEEIAGELKQFAQERKMAPEEAQQLLDMAIKQRVKEAEAFQTQRETWRESLRTDAEFGGAKLEANLSLAMKAVDAFGTPEAQELLKSSWLGDHPEIIKTFAAIGSAISEDRLVVSAGAGQRPGKDARSFYENSNMNP